MPYIQPETLKEIKKLDLLTYLRNYEPDELIHVSGKEYTTRTHDSLRISNGLWNWCSQGIGGKTALDYLIKVRGFSFMEAAEHILNCSDIQPPAFRSAEKTEKAKELVLPLPNRTNDNVFRYLTERGIDSGIINFCIQKNILYESKKYNNAVFVGLDKTGKPRYASLRGISGDFMGDAGGSDKRYSFRINSENGSGTLNVFESAVDLLSFATLTKLCGRDWRNENLLSLAGIYQPKKVIAESKIPAALEQYLADYPNTDRIVLRLDNDTPGRNAALAIRTVLPKKYETAAVFPKRGKDYNDMLCHIKGLPVTKRENKKER